MALKPCECLDLFPVMNSDEFGSIYIQQCTCAAIGYKTESPEITIFIDRNL